MKKQRNLFLPKENRMKDAKQRCAALLLRQGTRRMCMLLCLMAALYLACTLSYEEYMQPLPLALPHQPTKFVLVTALYDLHRADRSFEGSYIPWFRRTLRKLSHAASATVVFCKDRLVADEAHASATGHAIVVLEDNYPLSGMVEAVQPILQKRALSAKAWHPEWMNRDYILLQFSKFRWLQRAMRMLPGEQAFFWVDAGVSRFLLLGQRSMNFPLLVRPGLVSAQSNLGEIPANASALGECMGCRTNIFKGTLFGGDRGAVEWMSSSMLKILSDDFVKNGIMDNEQAGMALLYSRSPQRFNLLFDRDFLGRRHGMQTCHFICL